MHIIAIIQAHMGSKRLPGKVLKDIFGRTMLARVVRRTRQAKLVDDVVLATSTLPYDQALINECEILGTHSFRGSDMDVLDRYYQASQIYPSDAIVRITSDNPLIDPEIIDKVIQSFLDEEADYASNNLERTYPLGLDVEIFTVNALRKAWKETTEKYQRVHVTPYFYQNPELFRLSSVTDKENHSGYRWTVDTQEDLELIRAIYEKLDRDDTFSWQDVLTLLKNEPLLKNVNRHIKQKSLEEC